MHRKARVARLFVLFCRGIPAPSGVGIPLFCAWEVGTGLMCQSRKGGSMPDTKEQLAEWIDTDVIANAISEELEEQGVKPTLENAKTIWLDVLENELPDALRSSVKARFDVV